MLDTVNGRLWSVYAHLDALQLWGPISPEEAMKAGQNKLGGHTGASLLREHRNQDSLRWSEFKERSEFKAMGSEERADIKFFYAARVVVPAVKDSMDAEIFSAVLARLFKEEIAKGLSLPQVVEAVRGHSNRWPEAYDSLLVESGPKGEGEEREPQGFEPEAVPGKGDVTKPGE